MASQTLMIQSVSVTPNASQVSMTSQDVLPNPKEISQTLQAKSYKDQYAGSVQIDYTYSSLIKNNIRPKSSDIQYSSSDLLQSKNNVFVTQDASSSNAQSIVPRSSDARPSKSDLIVSSKDIVKEGDVRQKVVKDISKQVQKSVAEWNKLNLAKTNHLLKPVQQVNVQA